MKNNHRFIIVVAVLGLGSILPWLAYGGLRGSGHDFSRSGWNRTGQTCIVCHTPHNTKASPVEMLWNRDMSSAVYTLYSSPSLQATMNQPDGASRLCLSCHDGTIAVDRFGKVTIGGSVFVGGDEELGTDLSDDHPISFVYDSALSAAKTTLKDPASSPSGLGGTIAQDMLRHGKMQCVSCHDVHNSANIQYMLIKNNAGSSLCLTCHNF